MALAMKVISQVEAQRKILEEAVSTALELASGKSDGAEVAVSKTTGISVSTRYGEVENVEFNSDGALGITVYHQNRKFCCLMNRLARWMRRCVKSCVAGCVNCMKN